MEILIIITIILIVFVPILILAYLDNKKRKKYIEIILSRREQYTIGYLHFFPNDKNLTAEEFEKKSKKELEKRAIVIQESTYESQDLLIRRQRKEREEIDTAYSNLSSKYPNGINIYQKSIGRRLTKKECIEIDSSIFSKYERLYKTDISNTSWSESQETFAKECRSLKNDKINNWGCYNYDLEIKGKDETGKTKIYPYRIWQLFFKSYCLSEDIDYSLYKSAEDNREEVNRLLAQEIYYNDNVYDKLYDFISAIKGPKTIILNNEMYEDEEWESMESLQFEHLEELLDEANIEYIDSKSIDWEIDDLNSVILIIDLVTNNSRMIQFCNHILKSKSGKNSNLIYLSIFKEYDDSEMRSIIKEKERELIKEKEKKLKLEGLKKKREELKRLEILSHSFKDNYEDYKEYLLDNGIRCLYHFTDKKNLDSIKTKGGLYSWKYLLDHDILIPRQGGDDWSMQADSRFGLADYVRLSFCNDHPMIYRLQQDGYDLVLLKIKLTVALLEQTKFSTINAADSLSHTIGTSFSDLKAVNLQATQQHFVRKDSDIFKQHQAEVLVKTFIPIEYIMNINNPIEL